MEFTATDLKALLHHVRARDQKATLEGITLDDPTINEVPAIDDMQTVESDSPSFAQISSLAPEGRIFGAGS